jgi:hypothetical protein
MTIEEKKKVLEGLWLIKRECAENRLYKGRCDGCQCYNESHGLVCSLSEDMPYNWNLPPIQEDGK